MLDGEPHYTALQIAEMGLPGMPGTERGIHLLAARHGWSRRRHSGQGGGKMYPLEALRTRRSRKSADLHSPNPRSLLLRTQPPLRRSRTTKSASFSALGRVRGRWSRRRQRRCVCGDNTDGTSPEKYPSATPARLSAHSGRLVRPERRSGRAKPCRRSASPPCTDGTELWRRAV